MAIASSDRLSSNRVENSLYALTKKFFEFLKATYPKPINTNNLASFLKVSKRRVYDVTNILEGLGYLRKRSVNSMEWIGGDFTQFISEDDKKENNAKHKINIEKIDCHAMHEQENRPVNQIKKTEDISELEMLDNIEMSLNSEIGELNLSVQNMLQEESSITNAFVNNEDLLSIPHLSDKLIFVVKAPPETFLENKDTIDEYAIEMNVNNDKIDVFYISDEKNKS
ncbi:Transcription factor E2F/dimerization partner (TDP) [Pseudoloma neurophilia]|uniref:Transcription factor E2F/dimerization partner (TDP) n=1 Tax=Pseudoloma neurophilia TaxID=146866 RepID=A0A0R0M7P7_9MICR|nr:Transcription factor E2F/dimerization partner (TDP) [Pseudoloma neurophilia]